MTNIVMPLKTNKENVLEAKIVPNCNGYDFIISYRTVSKNDWKNKKQEKKESNQENQKKSKETKTTQNKNQTTHKENLQLEKINYLQNMFKQNPETKIASGDLGVSNLLVLTTNDPGVQPIIIDGYKLKAYNQYFNKKLAGMQQGLSSLRNKGKKTASVSEIKSSPSGIVKDSKSKPKSLNLAASIARSFPKTPEIERFRSVIFRKLKEKARHLHTSKAIGRLYQKRNHYLQNAMHVISNQIVKCCVSQGIEAFILGYNQNWKTGVNLGKRNNQNFVQLPFLKLVNLLEYKLAKAGILMIKTEESYTSKCSFLDQEDIKKHTSYCGVRVHRGLFKSKIGTFIHADVNASLNIGKKVAGVLAYQKWYVHSVVSGNAVVPVRVKFI